MRMQSLQLTICTSQLARKIGYSAYASHSKRDSITLNACKPRRNAYLPPWT